MYIYKIFLKEQLDSITNKDIWNNRFYLKVLSHLTSVQAY